MRWILSVFHVKYVGSKIYFACTLCALNVKYTLDVKCVKCKICVGCQMC